MGEYNQESQQQYGQLNQDTSNEEVVEFKATSPEIPQDVEFTPDQKLEDKIEDNLENQNR
jgi:hypothetical protein